VHLTSQIPEDVEMLEREVNTPDGNKGRVGSPRRKKQAYILHAAEGQLSPMQSVVDPGDAHAAPLPPGATKAPTRSYYTGPVPHLSPSDSYPELKVRPLMLSLARKLLNKRPDIRAEIRCFNILLNRAVTADVSTEDAPSGTISLPLVALCAIVEWEVAYVMHMTIREKLLLNKLEAMQHK
jgi:hypothetical protein